MENWITEAMVRRFDNLSAAAGEMEAFASSREQAIELGLLLAGRLGDEDRRLCLEWLALQGHRDGQVKEWFYYKGVQDGMRLLHYLLANKH